MKKRSKQPLTRRRGGHSAIFLRSRPPLHWTRALCTKSRIHAAAVRKSKLVSFRAKPDEGALHNGKPTTAWRRIRCEINLIDRQIVPSLHHRKEGWRRLSRNFAERPKQTQ